MYFSDICTKSRPLNAIPMCAGACRENAHIDQSMPRPGTIVLARVPIGPEPSGQALLSEHERRRAARLPAGRARVEFVTVRASLRQLLGALLGEPPDRLAIEADERGKPRLRGGDLRFSVAHTAGLGLIGVATDREVGVDVELIKTARATPGRERAALATTERHLAEGSVAGRRATIFFQRWSCKEAVAKATGAGIALPFRELVVRETSLTGRPATLLGAGADPPPVSVATIDLGPRYAAAVAAPGEWRALPARRA
jgi:4'-phosphopantetheinyl transferase